LSVNLLYWNFGYSLVVIICVIFLVYFDGDFGFGGESEEEGRVPIGLGLDFWR
jgi:hypothetical protein